MGTPRVTHTFATLEVSEATFQEIAAKLREAEYGHAFIPHDGGVAIDMHGIALVRAQGGGADGRRPDGSD